MQVLDVVALIVEELREVLGHALRERGEEHAFAALDGLVDLERDVLDLALRGLHRHHRVEQARRADDLLGEVLLRRVLVLVLAGSRRHVHALRRALFELVEPQRTVVVRAGQTEAVVDERLLAALVALAHAADLRDRDVRFVDEKQEVFREVIEQRARRRIGHGAFEVADVVLDARAVTRFLEHLDVIFGTHADAFGLREFAGLEQFAFALFQFGQNSVDRAVDFFLGGHVVARGEDRRFLQLVDHFAGEAVDLLDDVDLLERHLDADDRVARGRENFDRVAEDVNHALLEFQIGPLVLDVRKPSQKLVALDRFAALHGDREGFVVLHVAEAVDTRHRCDDEHVPAGEEVERSGVAVLLDLLVDARVFLDVGIGVRHVRLRLVVVVVRHEVRHRVLREEVLELGAELRGERLVVGQHERRALRLLDDVGHRERLARTRGAEERLVLLAGVHALYQLFDSLWLVAGRFEFRDELEGELLHKDSVL